MSDQDRADEHSRLSELSDDVRRKLRDYDALSRGKVELLQDRVVAFAPDAPALRSLERYLYDLDVQRGPLSGEEQAAAAEWADRALGDAARGPSTRASTTT